MLLTITFNVAFKEIIFIITTRGYFTEVLARTVKKGTCQYLREKKINKKSK